jgi:hypothetical protein
MTGRVGPAGWRPVCFAVAVAYVIGGLLLFARTPAATALWPWTDAAMSYVFLASIAAAVAASLLWIAIAGEFAAFAPLGLNAAVTNGGIAVYASLLAARGQPGLALTIAVTAIHALAGAWLFVRASRARVLDPRETPAVVRWSFAVFAIILLITGTALLLQSPRIFPWDLRPESSTVFGWLFIGAAVYFAYGFLLPRWAFAAGQLWGFLAYDLVLFIPYARMLVDPSGGSGYGDHGGYGGYGGYGSAINMPSLVVYLSVLAASTLLALHTFVLRRDTRIMGVARRS